GLLIAPVFLWGIHLDGGLNSPLSLALIPPAALAAAAFTPRDAAWHLVPLGGGFLFLWIAGPPAPGWVVAMRAGVLLSTVAPIMLVRRATLQYAMAQEVRADNLEVVSSVDGLTQCLNHRAFHDVLKAEVESNGTGQAFALLLIDVDRFKDVNDVHGHLAGDQVLLGLAQILRLHARPGDVIGRIGGEEFAVLLRRAGLAEAEKVAERLRIAVATGTPAGIEVTISSGVSVYWPGATVSQLRRHTDALLYRAKSRGRNTVVAEPPPVR
ncbi:MAG: GGDEF domain-containing protein, partial [Ilumatobacteraceae bacterium]